MFGGFRWCLEFEDDSFTLNLWAKVIWPTALSRRAVDDVSKLVEKNTTLFHLKRILRVYDDQTLMELELFEAHSHRLAKFLARILVAEDFGWKSKHVIETQSHNQRKTVL